MNFPLNEIFKSDNADVKSILQDCQLREYSEENQRGKTFFSDSCEKGFCTDKLITNFRNSIGNTAMRSNRTNRSLLGIPDRNDSAARFAQIQDEQLLERDNEKSLEELHSKVKLIKDISKDIETGITEGNKRIDLLVPLVSN